jgi:hypothetical protein
MLTPHADDIIWDHQCEIRFNRSTTDHIILYPADTVEEIGV